MTPCFLSWMAAGLRGEGTSEGEAQIHSCVLWEQLLGD